MFASLGKAAKSLFDHTLSGLVTASILITVAVYAALLAAALYGVHELPTLGWPWVNAVLGFLSPVLVLLLMIFLGAPAAGLFASLFLRTAARRIEARYYPAEAADTGAMGSLAAGLRLTLIVLVADMLLLPADAVLPGIAEFATLLVNGWFLGRGYFELVARRHISESGAKALRGRHTGAVFAAGVAISLLSAIPVLDFIAPLFGAALMVHLFQRYEHKEHA